MSKQQEGGEKRFTILKSWVTGERCLNIENPEEIKSLINKEVILAVAQREKELKNGNCKCKSSNKPTPEKIDDSVCLKMIDYFPELGYETYKDKMICVDACIAKVIEHLWKNKIITHGSCCGHNGLFGDKRPMLNLDNNITKEEAERIRSIIKEIDNRDWRLYSWIQTELTEDSNPTYHRTIVNSDIWKEWAKLQEEKMQFDIWESIECGWLSDKHWSAFIKWVKEK